MFPRRQALPLRFLSVMLLVTLGFGGMRSLQAGEEEAQAQALGRLLAKGAQFDAHLPLQVDAGAGA